MTAGPSGLLTPGTRPAMVPERQRPLGRIVVGVDGSLGSLAALRWAAAAAARRGLALRIVSAWEGADSYRVVRTAPPAASAAAALVQDALELVICLDSRPGSISCIMPEGEPGRVLIEQARDAEMLILGSHSGAEGGRTLRYCRRFAPCPLVIVRT